MWLRKIPAPKVSIFDERLIKHHIPLMPKTVKLFAKYAVTALIVFSYGATYMDLTMFSGERIVHTCGASNERECCCCCAEQGSSSDPTCGEDHLTPRACACSVSQQGCSSHSNAHFLNQNRDASMDVITARLTIFPQFVGYAAFSSSSSELLDISSVFHPPCS
jgi:hypothetical protein